MDRTELRANRKTEAMHQFHLPSSRENGRNLPSKQISLVDDQTCQVKKVRLGCQVYGQSPQIAPHVQGSQPVVIIQQRLTILQSTQQRSGVQRCFAQFVLLQCRATELDEQIGSLEIAHFGGIMQWCVSLHVLLVDQSAEQISLWL